MLGNWRLYFGYFYIFKHSNISIPFSFIFPIYYYLLFVHTPIFTRTYLLLNSKSSNKLSYKPALPLVSRQSSPSVRGEVWTVTCSSSIREVRITVVWPCIHCAIIVPLTPYNHTVNRRRPTVHQPLYCSAEEQCNIYLFNLHKTYFIK